MPEYRCTQCSNPHGRDELTVKRVQFRAMGARGKVKVTRVIAWLCDDCLVKDDVYNQHSYKTPTRQR